MKIRLTYALAVSFALISLGVLASCSAGNDKKSEDSAAKVAESAKIADEAPAEIPENALAGDFDGDGKEDHIWIEGEYDAQGYASTELVLRSDNPALEGLSWRDGMRGVDIQNLGDLNDSGRDFLGAVPYGDSDWCLFETYAFKDGKWKSVVPDFSIWLGTENHDRVKKSSNPGYVTVIENDPVDVDGGSPDVTRDLKIIW